MKKHFRTTLAFALAVSLFMGCEKEQSLLDLDRAPAPSESATQVIELLKDENDTQNDRANMILFHYANAVRAAIKDPELLTAILKATEEDVNAFGVSIPGLMSQSQQMQHVVEGSLLASVEQNNIYPKQESDLTKDDVSDYLTRNMYFYEAQYKPVVYRHTNDDGAVKPRDQEVIVAIAESVNDENEVIAYRGEEMFLLSEADAADSKDIIIFVGVGDDSGSKGSNVIIVNPDNPDGVPVESRADIKIIADNHRIKAGHRYESDNYSELRGFRMTFIPNQPIIGNLSNWIEFNTRDIHYSYIDQGWLFTTDRDAFNIAESAFNGNQFVFFGVYEEDWYASSKIIVNGCSNISSHSVQGKRKYSHEWYFFSCGQANQLWPSVGDNVIFENEKCMFDLKRII